jgi:putative endonuclease
MFYTYVLISEKDNGFYAGFTEDLSKRIEEHRKGKIVSTKHRLPLKLIYYEACLNRSDALKREKYFKTGFGRRFLNNRLKGFIEEFGR